jgi:hypothetical protein
MSKSETIPGSGTARRAPPERASSPPSDVAPRSSAFAGADGAKRCTSCQTVLADAVSVVARVVLASGESNELEAPSVRGAAAAGSLPTAPNHVTRLRSARS